MLARIDFAGKECVAEINDWCEHLAPNFVVDHANNAARTAAQMIERFASSPRSRELASATVLHREVEFLLTWPPGQSQGQYIQGFIDCLYQDKSGAWRIVDYKTNDVSAADIDYITSRYEMQLYVYALATERALGTSPTELVLQLLRPGIEHIIPWNNATRTRAVKMVSDAINTAVQEPNASEPSVLTPRSSLLAPLTQSPGPRL